MIKKENRVNKGIKWTQEEFDACLATYVKMVKLQSKGTKFKKIDMFRDLEKQFGRKANQYPLRFQNISHIMVELGVTVLNGSKPASGIGGKNRQYVIEGYYKALGKQIPAKWVKTFPDEIKKSKEEQKEVK